MLISYGGDSDNDHAEKLRKHLNKNFSKAYRKVTDL